MLCFVIFPAPDTIVVLVIVIVFVLVAAVVDILDDVVVVVVVVCCGFLLLLKAAGIGSHWMLSDVRHWLTKQTSIRTGRWCFRKGN